MQFVLNTSNLKAFIESETAFDLCRRIVYPVDQPGLALGASLHVIDVSGKIRMVAHFGKVPSAFSEDIFVWDDHPLAQGSKAAGLLSMVSPEHVVGLLPLTKSGLPLGILSIYLPKTATISQGAPDFVELISIAGGKFIDSVGLGSGRIQRSNGLEEWKDLTQRQLQVLAGMAEGMTNAEIARELLLSESTIRQETVRIYRALQVSGRLEAAKKAKALGLLGSTPVQRQMEAVAGN